ncbi:MAG TPA: alpha/beta hydrolase [Candidatus Acidoferrales bacterium]|nr:alpha/beta hydrolase [Candidatus Acidoferrales bacterium]
MKRFRASDGAELAYSDSGSGAPVFVFVHGWQGDRSVWRGIVAALAPEIRAITVDQRGSGDSNGAPGPYGLERLAADLHDLVTALDVAPVVIVGHSMGGTVALRFAVDYPEATQGLVLIAPVPASGGGFSERRVEYLRSTAGDPVVVRHWLTRTLSAEHDAATLDRLCAVARLTPREAGLESFASWGFADFADATRRIKAPALVIAPEHDAAESVKRNVAALLPNAEYVVLPDGAHYAIVEQPQQIAELIRQGKSRFG